MVSHRLQVKATVCWGFCFRSCNSYKIISTAFINQLHQYDTFDLIISLYMLGSVGGRRYFRALIRIQRVSNQKVRSASLSL